MKRTIITVLLIGGGVLFGYLFLHGRQADTFVSPSPSIAVSPSSIARDDIPLLGASARTTKKQFGTLVSPRNSPVSPERFSGYHAGLDFETLPGEQQKTINVRAVCDGALVLKKYAGGYGGVVAQSCALDGQAVTVVYGHLNLSSVQVVVGTVLHRGDVIGALGKGYSTETDGERKHLHLGIHKGTAVNLLGYVQRPSDLQSWIDPATILFKPE